MVDQGLITHSTNQYGINAYSKIIWNGIKNLNITESISNFLKTHLLPFDNAKLLNDFIKLKVEVISDMLSLLSFVRTLDTKNINKLQVVGIFDLKFEELFLKLIGDVVEIEHFELFMSIENVIELVA
ncbi:MAG: hypothetical protein ACFFAS_10915 [Promethearchaeota archaeon]